MGQEANPHTVSFPRSTSSCLSVEVVLQTHAALTIDYGMLVASCKILNCKIIKGNQLVQSMPIFFPTELSLISNFKAY